MGEKVGLKKGLGNGGDVEGYDLVGVGWGEGMYVGGKDVFRGGVVGGDEDVGMGGG